MIQNLEIIISLVGTTIGLFVTTLTFILKFIKNKKAKKIAEQALEIGNVLLPFIQEAEAFVSYTGKEKKEYVMTKANQYAIKNGIPFKAEIVSDKIEKLIHLTNKVNSEKKEKINVTTNEEISNNSAIQWL